MCGDYICGWSWTQMDTIPTTLRRRHKPDHSSHPMATESTESWYRMYADLRSVFHCPNQMRLGYNNVRKVQSPSSESTEAPAAHGSERHRLRNSSIAYMQAGTGNFFTHKSLHHEKSWHWYLICIDMHRSFQLSEYASCSLPLGTADFQSSLTDEVRITKQLLGRFESTKRICLQAMTAYVAVPWLLSMKFLEIPQTEPTWRMLASQHTFWIHFILKSS